MAGDWIKMRTNLDTDPRVIELASMLGLPELHVVGLLWKVWAWADGHTLDGNAIRVTHVTLDRFTTVTGFADALRKVGWLEGRDGALSFPRFAEHNGQTAKRRGETQLRVAKHRNAKSVTDVTEKCYQRREEKRRDIKKEHTHTGGNRSEAFEEAWDLWKAHLVQKQKPLTEITEETNRMDLSRLFPDDKDAIEVIMYSISAGARNLIKTGEHKQQNRQANYGSKTRSSASDLIERSKAYDATGT